MFLDLDIPDDDPLRPAKIFVSTVAPGFRLFEKLGGIDWESDFIWLVIVNEEDGLDFKVRQTVDGKREIQALWKDNELDDTGKLRDYLRGDPLWDVYQLRATVLLQGRVEIQIDNLKEMGNPQKEASVREVPWCLAERLRTLELNMLEKVMETFETQVRKCSPVIWVGGLDLLHVPCIENAPPWYILLRNLRFGALLLLLHCTSSQATSNHGFLPHDRSILHSMTIAAKSCPLHDEPVHGAHWYLVPLL